MKLPLQRTLMDLVMLVVTVTAALALGTASPAWYQKWKGNSRSGDFSLHLAGLPANITLYGTTTCPACINARRYLKDAGIPFNERLIDDSSDAKKIYATLNESSVPILVSQDKMLIGFNASEYAALAAAAVRH